MYDQQVAADVSSFTWPTENVGMCFVVATARPGVSADALEASVREVLANVRAEGIADDELEGALNRARRALVGQLNGFGDRADSIAHAAVLRGDAGYVNDAFGLYAGLDRAAVESVAGQVLSTDRMTAVHVVPEGGAS
jgi:predicted Zn-dependent peptidase